MPPRLQHSVAGAPPRGLTRENAGARPLFPVTAAHWQNGAHGLDDTALAWAAAQGFAAKIGEMAVLPAADGTPGRVLAGLGDDPTLWAAGGLAARLPTGRYHLETPGPLSPDQWALGWSLGRYAFTAFKSESPAHEGAQEDADEDGATLVWPAGADEGAVTALAQATTLVRDLVNAPAAALGPAELAAAAQRLAETRGATCRVIAGPTLANENWPAVAAVGAAGQSAPRVIDLRWGTATAPRLTLVGKGVCFDTGGLNLKPHTSMKLMRKDMGGAAHVLGLAALIMEAALPVRLRVLIPAAENGIGPDAMRPGDVVPTRKGLTVEIGHTDAEGRVILADALAAASEDAPDLIVDCATLTGAARVALGTEVPVLFANNDALAEQILAAGTATTDPLWRLPLWSGYAGSLDSRLADLNNAGGDGTGGAISAALFLERFVDSGVSWAHVDLMAWNTTSRPGRPEGGEAQGLRALFQALRQRYEG